MIESTPDLSETPESDRIVSPWFGLETAAFTRLQSFARTRGISIAEALHRLLDAGPRHHDREESPESQALSKKQRMVLERLEAGRSVKEIAGQLGVSEGTIRTHIHRIRQRRDGADLLALRFRRDGSPGSGDPVPVGIHPADPPGL